MSTLSWHLPLAVCMVPSDGSTYLMFAHKYGAKDSSLDSSYCISKKSSQLAHKSNTQSYFCLSLCMISYGFHQVRGEILGMAAECLSCRGSNQLYQ